MAFDNYYPNRKDQRKLYRGAKSYTRGCRNHNSCKYCEGNRIYFDRKARTVADEKLRDNS